MKPARQIFFLFPLMAGVLIFGTLGFHWVEGWEWFDSFFMALITLSTVGYQEIHPLSQVRCPGQSSRKAERSSASGLSDDHGRLHSAPFPGPDRF